MAELPNYPRRPTQNEANLKLRKHLHDEIVKWFKGGLPPDSAASMAGISPRTLQRWLMRGRQALDYLEDTGCKVPGEDRYVRLYKECARALAVDEASCVSAINRAVGSDWKAALAKLERRHPKNWSPKIHMVVEAEIGQLLQAMKDNLDSETYEHVLRSIRGPDDRSGTQQHQLE
jgi:hypothetical protein